MKNLLLSIFILALMPSFANGQTFHLTGTVMQNGATVPSALVILQLNYQTASNWDTLMTYTNENGVYNFEFEDSAVDSALFVTTDACPDIYGSPDFPMDAEEEYTTVVDLSCTASWTPEINILATPLNDEESLWYFTVCGNLEELSYVWAIDGATYTSANVTHQFDAPGTYTIELTLEGLNGETYSSSLTISAGDSSQPNCYAAFFPALDSIVDGEIYYVNTSLGSNLTYLWDFGDGTTSTEAYPTHTFPSDTTTYTVCLTISGDECQETYCAEVVGTIDGSGMIGGGIQVKEHLGLAKSGGFVFHVVPVLSSGVGVDEAMYVDMKLFPNPSSGTISLQIDAPIGNKATLYITDIRGKKVMEKNIPNQAKGSTISLSLENLVNGIYLIQYRGEIHSKVQKIVLQR